MIKLTKEGDSVKYHLIIDGECEAKTLEASLATLREKIGDAFVDLARNMETCIEASIDHKFENISLKKVRKENGQEADE